MTNIERHIVAAVLAAVAVYLKSPVAALMPVLVYVIAAAESVLARASKDAEIVALTLRAEAYEKRLKLIEQDIVNVAERAKLILGDTY